MIVSFTLTVISLLQNEHNETVENIGLIILSTLYGLAYIGMIVTTIIVTKSDPSDPTVAFERHIKA